MQKRQTAQNKTQIEGQAVTYPICAATTENHRDFGVRLSRRCLEMNIQHLGVEGSQATYTQTDREETERHKDGETEKEREAERGRDTKRESKNNRRTTLTHREDSLDKLIPL